MELLGPFSSQTFCWDFWIYLDCVVGKVDWKKSLDKKVGSIKKCAAKKNDYFLEFLGAKKNEHGPEMVEKQVTMLIFCYSIYFILLSM